MPSGALPDRGATSTEPPGDPGGPAVPLLPAINCSTVACKSADEPILQGYRMFNEQNFAPLVDGWGRMRKFYVHIPKKYDDVDGMNEKIPVIFAFHGGGQTREAMLTGKWADFFEEDYAIVIPLGESDPCDNPGGVGKAQWMQPGVAYSTSPGNPSCDPATQVVTNANLPRTYWKASLPGSFTDVRSIEHLRSMLLARFPKLNADKVYATGFSAGGGMTLTLACYRAALFRGFSVVAKTLGTDSARGDYDEDGIMETDPQSLVATCGKDPADPMHATGIMAPQLWGLGTAMQRTRPVALFVGDQDYTMQEINDTGNLVRARNNLSGVDIVVNPFLNIHVDDATTELSTFASALDPNFGISTFHQFLVQGVLHKSAGHAIPDDDEYNPSTRDYSYTDQTVLFFQNHADLNLNP